MNFTSVHQIRSNKNSYSFLSTREVPGPYWVGTINPEEEIRGPGPSEGTCRQVRGWVDPVRPACALLPVAPRRWVTPGSPQPWESGVMSAGGLLHTGMQDKARGRQRQQKQPGCRFEERMRAEKREEELGVLFSPHRCMVQRGMRVGWAPAGGRERESGLWPGRAASVEASMGPSRPSSQE